MSGLAIGETRRFSGDVTTLNMLRFGSPREVESMLGFRQGRLAQGYFILLLVEPLQPDDFEFAGTTLRSGGRSGLPLHDPALDRARTHVSDQMRGQYGAQHYDAMRQRQAAERFTIKGANRIAKILPAERLGSSFDPAVEFPMGGGAGQWTIAKEHARQFLVAAEISPDLTATTPGFSVSLAEGQPQQQYTARARLQQYLQTAP